MRLNTNVSAGILTLAEGRWITPSDDHACVISQALAEKNALDLGDDISFASLDGKGSTEKATIVGIFPRSAAADAVHERRHLSRRECDFLRS